MISQILSSVECLAHKHNCYHDSLKYQNQIYYIGNIFRLLSTLALTLFDLTLEYNLNLYQIDENYLIPHIYHLDY